MKRRDFLRVGLGGSLLFLGRALRLAVPVGGAASTGGCGGLAGIAAVLCVPCEFIVVIAAAIGAFVVGVFLDRQDDDCECHPPPDPRPPPPEPPPEDRTWICVENVPTSECPIDGIWVEDPDDPIDVGVWIFGGPQAEKVPGHPEYRKPLSFERMSWPDRPEFSEYRGTSKTYPLIYFGDSEGNGDRWMRGSGRIHLVIHFNHNGNQENPEGVELDITEELRRLGWIGPNDHPVIDPGATFKVEWHSVRGWTLVGYVP